MTEMSPEALPSEASACTQNTKAPFQIAIYGSCVSRDTCEHLPNTEVVAYVARQSMITALHPVGAGRFSADALDSDFQARMFTGDQIADGVSRIAQADADVLLIDLVDERRGVWQFPDGSFLTNSIEATRAGVEAWAPKAGARLIRFGSDEHFELWERGLRKVMKQLLRLRATVMFLDIAWAEAFEGSRLPGGARSEVGRLLRRMQRGGRQARRSLGRGDPLVDAIGSFVNPTTTPAEQLIAEAREGNMSFARYRKSIHEYFTADGEAGGRRHVIERGRAEVRTSSGHRWGPAPYHYRKQDYESIAAEILNLAPEGGAA